MRPDYSAEMLKSFLRIHVEFENLVSFAPGFSTRRIEREKLRLAAGVSKTQFHAAWQGHAATAAVRTRLWAALGIYPGLDGWILTDDGGQVAAGSAEAIPRGKAA